MLTSQFPASRTPCSSLCLVSRIAPLIPTFDCISHSHFIPHCRKPRLHFIPQCRKPRLGIHTSPAHDAVMHSESLADHDFGWKYLQARGAECVGEGEKQGVENVSSFELKHRECCVAKTRVSRVADRRVWKPVIESRSTGMCLVLARGALEALTIQARCWSSLAGIPVGTRRWGGRTLKRRRNTWQMGRDGNGPTRGQLLRLNSRVSRDRACLGIYNSGCTSIYHSMASS